MDIPRKKGFRRFLEVLTGDITGLIQLNLYFFACALPSAALFFVGFFGLSGGYVYLLSLAAAFPIGGACSACMFCLAKMLRDAPGHIWHDFKRKLAENLKSTMAAGILHTAFIYTQICLWRILLSADTAPVAGGFLLSLASFLLFGMIAPYVFLLYAYIDLPGAQILRISALLSFSHIPRSLAGSLAGGSIWIAFVLFLPTSLILIPPILLCGFSLSWLLILMWIWSPVDRQFAIEETLRGTANHESTMG